jgi:serine protease Do
MKISTKSLRARALAAGVAAFLATGTPHGQAAGVNAGVDYAALVERHGPAVVHVSVREKLVKSEDKATSASRSDIMPSKSFGSGFIVSADGYILTNAHVVNQATRIRVTLKDKRELTARIVGEDATTDVALLKVDAADLPAVTIGDAARVRVGEPVAAIGSPFGFEHSVTAGIVSAKSRNVDDLLVPFIQTDAAVNPGNSGGPLFNAAGEVIGINSRIWTKSGGFQGLSFAIPIDLAMRIAEELKGNKQIVRGRIGVHTQPVTTELARAFGLDRARGALITSVDTDGPAQRAGLQTGDIVMRAADREVETSLDLQRVVGSQSLGAAIAIDVLRQGKSVPLLVTVAAAEETPQPSEPVSVSVNDKQTPLGLELRAMNPQEKQRLGASEGLYVESVAARSPALRAELKAGDLILQVRGRPVLQIADFRDGVEAAAADGAPVAVLTLRGEQRRFVALELDR